MAARLTVVAGPPRSGKTQRLLEAYRAALVENRPGAALWLAPTWRVAAEIRGRLLCGRRPGYFSPGVMTFENFAEAVLQVAPVVIRRMSGLMKRQLIRQIIDKQLSSGRLDHFRPIASTSGLVDLVCRFISELKRLEIWPEEFRQACRRRGITPKDEELLEIYDQYQQYLREDQLYDAEGRFWSARRLLKEGQRRPFERLRLVVADGFTDFTRTQHEILEILAGRVDQITITLPLEEQPRREDLFAKPLKTLGELRRRHQGRLKLKQLARPKHTDWPAMAHLERSLFRSPQRLLAAEDTAGVEILAAARRTGEMALIGSRIKRLLVHQQVRPDEIAVVLRSLDDHRALLSGVFDGLGIPFVMHAPWPLDRSPALRALLGLMRLDSEDWPFRAVLAVLGSNYFRPDWPEWRNGEAAAAVERAIRGLQIPRGRKRLFKGLQAAENNTDRKLAMAVLTRFSAALDELPDRATPAGWAGAWRRLAQETGLLRVVQQEAPRVPRGGLSDKAAWERLIEALGSTEKLARWLSQQPPHWNRREALAALADIAASQGEAPSGDEAGCVRVLPAAGVRGLRVPYLFLAGLSEKGFPPPDREDRLYGEPEYQRLIDAGLPLVARRERNCDEMLLFYEVITRATRRLYLSYPALDESAQPLSPSPFLEEVEQACGPGRIVRMELTDLSPVPRGDEPLSPDEFRLKAVSSALEGDVALLAGLMQWRQPPGLAENIVAGLQVTHLRGNRDAFGPAEGVLRSDDARSHLSSRFSLQKTFSATDLEQYAACPFRFFLQRVLQLEPVEELALTVDPLQRGRLAHAVMALFHRRVNQALGRPGSPLEPDGAERDRLLSEALAECFESERSQGILAGLREADRRLLAQWLAGYGDQYQRYLTQWRELDAPPVPEFFEVSFGRPLEGEDPPSTEQPLELQASGRTVRIAGRVDRVDTGQVAGKPVFNVIDYKTGSSIRLDAEAVAAGTALQLPLYAFAVAELVLIDRNPVPWEAGYWYLRGDGFKPGQALQMYRRGDAGVVPDPHWETIRWSLPETVLALVEGIRRGEFPVHGADERCTGYCPYRTICRVNQVRSLEKTWRPEPIQD